MSTTPAQLVAIRNRLNATTKGRWEIQQRRKNAIITRLVVIKDNGSPNMFSYGFIQFRNRADAEFAIQAREDIRTLLQEISDLQATLAQHGIDPNHPRRPVFPYPTQSSH